MSHKELLSDLEVPWSNTAALSTPHFLQQGTIGLSNRTTHPERITSVHVLHVGFVAGLSAKEVLCQWLSVAQTLWEMECGTCECGRWSVGHVSAGDGVWHK